jgi:hypothetical protein
MAYFGSTTALGAGETFTSQVRTSDRADTIGGSVFASTAGNLIIEQSGDGTNWDLATTVAVTANTGTKWSDTLWLPFVRVRYVPTGGAASATFRLFGRYTSAGDS